MRLSMRLTLAMTALVLCTVGAFGLLAYYNIGHAVVPAGVQRLADQTKARIGAIDALLRTVRSTLIATAALGVAIVAARLGLGLLGLTGASALGALAVLLVAGSLGTLAFAATLYRVSPQDVAALMARR